MISASASVIGSPAAARGSRAPRSRKTPPGSAHRSSRSGRSDARISPLLGNLAGLPPCLTVVSQCEILRDDALRLHDKLQALGSSSTCLQWKHTPHAFAVMARLLPEARDALRQTADFIARVLRA